MELGINPTNFVVSHSEIVLDLKSRERLLRRFEESIPNNWKLVYVGPIIKDGETPKNLEKFLGLKVCLLATRFAQVDNFFIVGVEGFNEVEIEKFIVLAKSPNTNGRKQNDEIDCWKELKKPIRLIGTFSEVPIIF